MLKFFFAALILTSVSAAQEWKYFTSSNSGLPSNLVYALVIAPDGTVWAGTGSGLASFNGQSWTVYDTSNSPLPHPYITALDIDSLNTVWIGMGYAGVARFAKGSWTAYDTATSDLPDNTIFDITIGPDQTPWFATNNGVVNIKENKWKNIGPKLIESRSRSVIFDQKGVLWMGTYDPVDFRGYIEYMNGDSFSFTVLSKLDLISTHANCMLAAKDSSMFIGTGYGLARVVNGMWTVYRSQNSPLPANGILSLASVGDTVIVGTASGAAEYIRGSWNVILPSPGTLPNDIITAVAVDKYGNRWFATGSSGIAVYKKGGIVSPITTGGDVPRSMTLLQNYPNPFNPTTNITYTLTEKNITTLVICDALGREVATLVNDVKSPGTYTVQFNGENYASGIYVMILTSGVQRQMRKLMLLK